VEAENVDRQSLDLPGHQNDLLRDAYTYGETSQQLQPASYDNHRFVYLMNHQCSILKGVLGWEIVTRL